MPAEWCHYTQLEIESFARSLGLPIGESTIKEIYPVIHEDRRVFRVVTDGIDSVFKIRPLNDKATEEFQKAVELIDFYNHERRGFSFTPPVLHSTHNYAVIQLPWMGIDFNRLLGNMDLVSMGYEPDNDTPLLDVDQIRGLLEVFRQEQMMFAKDYKLIHGDLFQHGAPNNVVYHPDYQRLFPVDCEAYGKLSAETHIRFINQMTALTG